MHNHIEIEIQIQKGLTIGAFKKTSNMNRRYRGTLSQNSKHSLIDRFSI